MSASRAKYDSDAQYHNDRERISGSALDLFARNPKQFRAWMWNRWSQRPTEAMVFGSLFHAMVLEPETVSDRYVIPPFDPKRPGRCVAKNTKVYKEWAAEHASDGQAIITNDDYLTAASMLSRLKENEHVSDVLFSPDGENEVAFHFEVKGRKMRAKMDRIIPSQDVIVELKTCRSAKPTEGNAWSWERMGYNRKAWLYLECYRQVFGRNARMVHIFVEKGRHPQISWFWSDHESPAVKWGELEACRLLDELSACEESGRFESSFEPGASPEESLPLPGAIQYRMDVGVLEPVELDFGNGETVTM